MRTNTLGRIGMDFVKACGRIEFKDKQYTAGLSKVLSTLKDVKLKDGLVAETITPGRGGLGGECMSYVRKRATKPLLEWIAANPEHTFWKDGTPEGYSGLLEGVDVQFTEEGIWSAYLLNDITCSLPLWWHANYAAIDYVFDMDCLTKICKLKDEEVKTLLSKSQDQVSTHEDRFHYKSELDKWLVAKLSQEETILPKVTILDGTHAVIEYTYWSDWHGLVFKTVKAEMKNGRISFDEGNDECLAHYDCGIMF